MTTIIFTLIDYKNGLRQNNYIPRQLLAPYYDVDRMEYRKLETQCIKDRSIKHTLFELRKRTGYKFFLETCSLQTKTLNYSAKAFPAYKFLLSEVIKGDWLALVDWSKYHRDHVLHLPLCGYILLKLIGQPDRLNDTVWPNGKTLLKTCVDNILHSNEACYIKDFLTECGMKEDNVLLADSSLSQKLWQTIFIDIAYLATIFHDIGYPWQNAEQLRRNLLDVNTESVMSDPSYDQVISLFGNRLLYKALSGYHNQNISTPSTIKSRMKQITEEALLKTHGFSGSLCFLYLNDRIRRYPSLENNLINLLCIEWAAVAIMMHDMVSVYWGDRNITREAPKHPALKLSFDRDPLSSLVAFVDILQEFERPCVQYSLPDNESVTLNYKPCCTETQLIINNRDLTIRYKFVDDAARANKIKRIFDEKYKYFDSKYGFLDMSGLGIRNVYMEAYK